MFWLLITSKSIEGGRSTSEQELYEEGLVLHKYTGLSTQHQRASIESIPNWRQRFPLLSGARDLDSSVIHMDTSLDLMSTYPPERAELVSRIEFSMPATSDLEHHSWQVITSLNMPPELCKDPSENDRSSTSQSHAISTSRDEISIKVSFPAVPWAFALVRLTEAQLRYIEERRFDPIARKSAREFLDQISMYQAIQSSPSHGRPFETRAIILWTFHKATHGEPSGTTWRYLNAPPPRGTIMSPSPQHSSQLSAIMNENFHVFETGQQPSMLGSFSASGLHSPYANQGFNFAAPAGYEMPSKNNLSFSSAMAADSDGTLVSDTDHNNIDHYLASTSVGVGLDYGGHDAHNWHMPPSESFSDDPAWADYSVPSTTPQLGAWDASVSNAKIPDPWHDALDGKPGSWDQSTPRKQHDWEGSLLQKGDWEGAAAAADATQKIGWEVSTANKPDSEWAPGLGADRGSPKPSEYGHLDPSAEQTLEQTIEHSIEQKLRPWIENHAADDNTAGDMVADPVVTHLEEIAALEDRPEEWVDATVHLDIGDLAPKEEGWVDAGAAVGEEFDFDRLVDHLH